MLRPVDSLNRQKRPLSQGFDPASYPTKPPASYRANRPLPGWDFHPRGDRAVRGAPEGHGGGLHRCETDPEAVSYGLISQHQSKEKRDGSVALRGPRSASVLKIAVFWMATALPGYAPL